MTQEDKIQYLMEEYLNHVVPVDLVTTTIKRRTDSSIATTIKCGNEIKFFYVELIDNTLDFEMINKYPYIHANSYLMEQLYGMFTGYEKSIYDPKINQCIIEWFNKTFSLSAKRIIY